MLDCPYRGHSFNDMLQHIRQKSVKVNINPLSDDVILEGCRARNAYCELCCVRCTSEHSLQQHLKGKKHRMNEFRETYRGNRFVSFTAARVTLVNMVQYVICHLLRSL